MAAKKLINVDWKALEEQVGTSKRSTGTVELIREACKEIMADGKEYEIRKLQGMINLAVNDGVADEDKIAINWVTVKYTIMKAGGFREVSKNTFVMDETVKKPAKKGRK